MSSSTYDLVVHGGTVIDPAAGLHAERDVAILELQEGDFILRDNEGQTIPAGRWLRPWRTVRAGQVVEAPPDS